MNKGIIALIVIIVLLIIGIIIGVAIWLSTKKKSSYSRERYDINDNFVSLNLASSFLDSLSVSNNKVVPTVNSILTKYSESGKLTSPQKQIINQNV